MAGGSGREVTIDVLVEPAGSGTRVARDDAATSVEPTLQDVRTDLILLLFAKIGAWDGVPPVRPCAEGGAVLRVDPEVVTSERHRPSAELLELAVRRDVREPNIRRPRAAIDGAGRCVDIE